MKKLIVNNILNSNLFDILETDEKSVKKEPIIKWLIRPLIITNKRFNWRFTFLYERGILFELFNDIYQSNFINIK